MSAVGEKMPLLSICIPSYNRAELLRSTLSAVVPQVRDFKDDVELVVSDNCSVDHTKAVVDSFMESCPISYHRNNDNLGPGRNIALLIGKLARGEYCWIIGDDDTICEGGVGKIVEILKAHPELDYVYVNYCTQIPFPRENKNSTPVTDVEWPNLGNKDRRERRVDRWEQLLEEDRCHLSATFSSVFRLSLCRGALSGLHIRTALTNVDTAYPHTIALAKTMVGKPCWSTGSPLVIYGLRISYTDRYPLIVLVLQDLFDILEELGVDPKYLRTHRRNLLRSSGRFLADIVQNPDAQKPEEFNFRDFVFKFFEYGELIGFLLFLANINIRRGFRKYPMISTIAMCAGPLVLLFRGFKILRNERNMREH